jgi:dihydrofolate reductase
MSVIADITMSLDGFVTGPDPGPERGLGRDGEGLHTWAMSDDEVDAEVLRAGTEQTGAVVMGRRLFDVIDGPHGWTEDMGYGAREVGTPPFFVVTHQPPASRRLTLDFTYVTDGVAAAVAQARAAAGERDVVVMGGAEVVRQTLELGLVDELRLHVSPLVLGAGTPLFRPGQRHDLVQREVRSSAFATHLTYVPA